MSWLPPRGSIVYHRTAPHGDERDLVRPYVMTAEEWRRARAQRPSRAVLRRVLGGLRTQGAGS